MNTMINGKALKRENNPIINMKKCSRCGECIAQCPENALRMGDEGPVFVHPNTCTFCTLCESICPQDAIRAPFTITWASEIKPNPIP
jgi:ferredoxin